MGIPFFRAQVFPFVEARSLAGYYAFEKSVYDAIGQAPVTGRRCG
jgi:hypothetical protein